MGFLSNILSATVKTVLTPVAVVVDAAEVVTGGDSNNTKKIIKSAGEDVKDATEDLADGEIL